MGHQVSNGLAVLKEQEMDMTEQAHMKEQNIRPQEAHKDAEMHHVKEKMHYSEVECM
jgi:hypothetical protein